MISDKGNIYAGLKNGDENIFIQLFREYYVCLCAYSRKYVGRKEIAEEIVTDIFYTLWKNRNELIITTSIKSYLFKAVFNNSIQYLRNLAKEKSLTDLYSGSEFPQFSVSPDEMAEKSLLREDFFEKIEVAVMNLPPQQQQAFRLKRYEGKKNKEIAEIMGIAVKTVEMHLSKALLKLREDLKSSVGDFLFFLLVGSRG